MIGDRGRASDSILQHSWGVSPHQDRIWAQVNGLAPSKAGGRLLMVWQAYLDESEDDGVFVLAGYLASAAEWVAFSKAWEELLPLGVMDKHGKYRFKMSEMAANEERMKRVLPFARVTDQHVRLGIAAVLKLDDLKRAKERLVVLDNEFRPIAVSGDFTDNHYLITFLSLIFMFHKERSSENISKNVPEEEIVDFIFDDRTDKVSAMIAWDQSAKIYQNFRFGSVRFEDDNIYLPLQAADAHAWWTREAFSDPNYKPVTEVIGWTDIGMKTPSGNQFWFLHEDWLVHTMVRNVRANMPSNYKVFDKKLNGNIKIIY